jgi:beta-aspartyl-peptidase (threonine type)
MILLVHGGAGHRRPKKRSLDAIAVAISAGYGVLRRGGPALDAVVSAIVVLEDSGLFNAGLGANLQLDGVQRLDASVMEGRALNAGAVVGLEGIRNPVMAARKVLYTSHVMLTDTGARKLARGLPTLPKPSEALRVRLKKLLRKETDIVALYREYFSTVGVVALDARGDLAAGTSTGGTYAMLPGRVGDTPVIGAGTYAENATGAVSCTGAGEFILRRSLAKEVCMYMKTTSPSHASRRSLRTFLRLGGAAGLIALDRRGRFTLMHTTDFMAGGYARKNEVVVAEGFTRVG